MRGPAPGRFDAMAIQIQSPRGEGQMRITQDLTQRMEIGRLKAHELGWGTWSRRRNGHCYRTRFLAGEAFLAGQIALVATEPHIAPASKRLWLWCPSDSPRRFRRLAGSLTVFNGLR